MVEHITQYRVVPVDTDAREVDTPHDDVLAVGGHAGANVYIHGFDLAGEGVAGDFVDDPRYERALVVAVGGSGRSGAGRVCWGCAGVSEDTAAVEVVEGGTGGFGFGAEPVVAGCLIGVDYYVVALA